jgi:hypothetical protein
MLIQRINTVTGNLAEVSIVTVETQQYNVKVRDDKDEEWVVYADDKGGDVCALDALVPMGQMEVNATETSSLVSR